MAGKKSRFLLLYASLALVLTFGAILGVQILRQRLIRRGLRRCEALFAAGNHEEGFARLGRLQGWASVHPALDARLDCVAIEGLCGLSDFEGAAALAARMARTDGTTAPRSNAWQTVNAAAAPAMDAVLLAGIGGAHTDRWSGYRTLARALLRADESVRLSAVEQEIATLAPDSRLVEMVRAEARAAAAAAVPSPTPVRKPSTPPPVAVTGEGYWGVANHATTRVYNTSGKFLRTIEAGTVLGITKLVKSKEGQLALCPIAAPDGTETGIVIRTAQLDVQRGALDRVDEQEKKLRVRKALLAAQIHGLTRAAPTGNPHLATYVRTQQAYDGFWKKVKRLQAKRDTATGAERIGYADQLHKLKGQDIELGRAYEAAKQKYEEWNQKHAAAALEDPRIAALEADLAVLRQQLARFYPDAP